MKEFLNRNAGAIQAMAAIVTVLIALAALVGVKWQIDAADEIQRAQSARDIYREYLNLSVANPAFAQPDYCAIQRSDKLGAYDSYVGYLLYAAEQNLSVSDDWKSTMFAEMKTHASAICDIEDNELELYTPTVGTLIKEFQTAQCAGLTPCP